MEEEVSRELKDLVQKLKAKKNEMSDFLEESKKMNEQTKQLLRIQFYQGLVDLNLDPEEVIKASQKYEEFLNSS